MSILATVVFCPVGPVAGPPHEICIPQPVPSRPIKLSEGVDRDPRGPQLPRCIYQPAPGCTMVQPTEPTKDPITPIVLKFPMGSPTPRPLIPSGSIVNLANWQPPAVNPPPRWTRGSATRKA